MLTSRLEKTTIVEKKSIFLVLLVSTLLILVRSSWVGDDAYITMRTVDNFVQGLGLTWNSGERVQSFTHPLWFWMLVLLYSIFPKISFAYFAILILSLLCSMAVFWIVLKMFENRVFAMLSLWLMLISSRAFLDYSTSGLENPASHLLSALFFGILLTLHEDIDRKIFSLYLIACFAALNRIDTILIYLPSLLYLLSRSTGKSRLLLLLSFLPLVLWEVFSLIYFGFLFPNTAYAKLNTGIPLILYLKQGGLYFVNSLRWDPITLFVISSAMWLALVHGRTVERMMAAGIGLYLVYIIYIGGDFMSGRFFSILYLLAAILLVSYFSKLRIREQAIFFLLILGFGYAGTSPVFLDWRMDNKQMRGLPGGDLAGIGDQRQLWGEDSTLLNLNRVSIFPSHIAVEEGLARRNTGGVFAELQIGYLGFFAGSKSYIIDHYALTDPLLARLPIEDIYSWRIGHFYRSLPDGYLATIENGENMISDPNLATYYEKIKLIISGDIWSMERFDAIWRMNTGQYDYLIDNYLDGK
jgi:arabinofuranosyltransferase